MKKIIVFILFMMLQSSFATIGGKQYGVITCKGEIYFQNKDRKWIKVEVGQMISEDATLKIQRNYYITIFCKEDNQYIVIHGERQISIKDIFEKPKTAEIRTVMESLSKVLSNFSGLFKSKETESQFKMNMRSAKAENKFLAISPKKCIVFNENINFRWTKNDPDTNYRFVLIDDEFKIKLDTIIHVPHLNLNFRSRNLDLTKEYIWRVIGTNDRSENKDLSIFKYADSTESANINKDLADFDKLNLSSDSPEYFLIKGLLFEEHICYSNALEIYLEGSKVYPKNKNIEKALSNLFEKMNIRLNLKDSNIKYLIGE